MNGQATEVIDLASYRAKRAGPVAAAPAMQPHPFGMCWVPVMFVPCWVPFAGTGTGVQQAV